MLNRAPSVYTISTLQAVLNRGAQASPDGLHWHYARPEGMHSIKSRLRLAWEVFCGRADVLRWPGHQ